jgi:hypothetical protein
MKSRTLALALLASLSALPAQAADCLNRVLVSGDTVAYGQVRVELNSCEDEPGDGKVVEIAYDHHPLRSVLLTNEDYARVERIIHNSAESLPGACARREEEASRHSLKVKLRDGNQESLYGNCAGRGPEMLAVRLRSLVRDLYARK